MALPASPYEFTPERFRIRQQTVSHLGEAGCEARKETVEKDQQASREGDDVLRVAITAGIDDLAGSIVYMGRQER